MRAPVIALVLGLALAPPLSSTAQRIEGIVRDAADGGAIMVQTAPRPAPLITIRLADVQAPKLTGPGGEGAKWRLRRAARGRTVVCVTQTPGPKPLALCTIGGVSVGRLVALQP